MRSTMVVAGILLAVAALAVEVAGGRLISAADEGVTAENFLFTDGSGDDETNVFTGDTVTWTFADDLQHNVVADGGAFDSGNPQTGGTFAFTFSAVGTFAYHCEVHGGAGGTGMSGTITVEAAPTATATNTAVPATATPPATSTPGTPTVTATPGTPTVTPVATIAAPVATSTAVVAVPISAEDPGSGAAPSLGAPRVGDGAAQSRRSPRALSMTLAVVGMLLVGSAVAVRRRA